MTDRSYRLGVDQGLSWALTALLAAFAATWLVVAGTSREHVGPALWAAIAALVGLTVLVALRSAGRALGDRHALAAAFVAVALQLAWRAHPALEVTPGQRCMMTTATVFCAVGFASRRTGVAAVTLAVLGQVLTDVTVDGPLAAAAGLWPVLAAGIATGACVPALRAAARRADDAAAEQRAASVERAMISAERDAQRELQDLLHDQIVTALRTISLDGVTTTEAIAAARTGVDAIGRTSPGDDGAAQAELAARVRTAAAASGIVTSLSAGQAVTAPGPVVTAAVAALGEVLRNVDRHARAQRVRVVLEADGDGFVLTTTDDGVGFPTAAGVAASHGLRHSVIRRMESVGGRADVTSVPGSGTTVRLSWHPRRTPSTSLAPTRAERIAAALVDVRLPLAAIVGPYLAMTGVLAVAFTVNGTLPAWLPVWFAGLAGVTLALLGRANTGLAGPPVAGALAYGVVGTVAALVVLPPNSLEDYSSWPLGATTALLALTAVVRPAREATSALVAHQLAIAAAVLTGHLGEGPWQARVAQVAPAALSAVTPVVLGTVISRAVIRLGDVVSRANRERDLAAAATAARGAREAWHATRVADLGAEVLPFLSAVAHGSADHRDPQVRELARAMEQAARDELHLPGVLTRDVRTVLHRARAAGCTVRIQNTGADADADLVCRLVATALGSGPVPRELVLSVGLAGGSRIGLVATPGDAARAEALRREFGPMLRVLEATSDVTWAEVSTA